MPNTTKTIKHFCPRCGHYLTLFRSFCDTCDDIVVGETLDTMLDAFAKHARVTRAACRLRPVDRDDLDDDFASSEIVNVGDHNWAASVGVAGDGFQRVAFTPKDALESLADAIIAERDRPVCKRRRCDNTTGSNELGLCFDHYDDL